MSKYTKINLTLFCLFISYIGFSQELKPFEIRYQNNLKGELTFISNQILNRDGGTPTTTPQHPYNNLSTDSSNDPETGGRYNTNNAKNMQYVRVDNSPGIFSSSSSILSLQESNCNKISYAGLYWSAYYPSATGNGTLTSQNTVPIGEGRQDDFNTVKLKIPGNNSYSDITADEIIYDGFNSTNSSIRKASPYLCYADVTSLLQSLENPTGEYTVANVRATTGMIASGGAAGWTMVIVYENPNLTSKQITTFDGFGFSNRHNTLNINYSGFKTIPTGHVNAKIGSAALEGDFRLTGDYMSIKAASKTDFTQISNALNPKTNFFNSSITLNGAYLPGRTPSSKNTLSWDTDLLQLNNPSNSVLGNNETSATFRFGSVGDGYAPFFNSLSIEIIEPEILLEKRVEDISGTDITDMGVGLGQTIDYVLTFKNRGNDDATNYTIKDILPNNVTLDESNFVLPAGVTYTYTPATRTVLFTIPDNLVEVGDTKQSIRMRVKVSENCYDFTDACANKISNIAYSTYQGVTNDNQISDDPSVSKFDECITTSGSTNFITDDLENCSFERTVQLCGTNVVLNAGDNFDSYRWVRDTNNNNVIDNTDIVMNDGDPDNDPSTLIVSEEGTYIVDKVIANPCSSSKERMVVERFGSNTVDPIVNYFNTVNNDTNPSNNIEGEIVTCSIDGDELTKIFLCGASDSQIIKTNITDAQTIVWEKLDETSCTESANDCANKNASCTWNQVATGSTYNVNNEGKYRLVVTYQNGCFNRFYFEAYQNLLEIKHTKKDLICTSDGEIRITNLGTNYGFQLIDITNNSILVPYSANNGPVFTITTSGQYRVDVTQLDNDGNPLANACEFSTSEIGIREREYTVNITTTPQNCNDQGKIKVDILNVEPNYNYYLRKTDGTLIDDQLAETNNTHTFNVNAGDYTIEATTVDGCTYTENITVERTPDPTISATLTNNIGCSAGYITVTGAGGFPNPDYSFAIWSKNGTNLYTNISDIPANAYQSETAFSFGWRDTDNDGVDEYFPDEEGTYTFVLVDANDCFAISNPVTISDNGAMTVSINEDRPSSCSGTADAAITITPSGGLTPYSYTVNDGTTTKTQSSGTFVGLNSGPINIEVTDSSGCTVKLKYDISEPLPLSASVGVSRDATCDPNGAEVRVTNVNGGVAPYEYSFDGGSTYGSSSVATLNPGDYTVLVKDANDCSYSMSVTVENRPTPPEVTLTPEVSYDCNGSAIITATPNINTYTYNFSLDGVLNTPPTSNVFTNVAPGTYTVRTTYTAQENPSPSLLLSEDFGSGSTIPNPNTVGYFYEDQFDNTSPSGAPNDSGKAINDYEYAVTSHIEAPFRPWYNSNGGVKDHTSNGNQADGRFLVINIGAPEVGQIIYQKTINDIIPNRPLDISLWLFNLISSSRNLVPPDLNIELRDITTGAIIATNNTGLVPNNEQWNNYTLSLDPESYTSLNLVITTKQSETSGNDVVIDDITVYQQPEICWQYVDTPVTVVAGKKFEATGITSSNISCNGDSNATITFEVENFNASEGFDYSVDNGTTYIHSTSSPVTTAAIFGAGTHTIIVRKADEVSCTSSFSTTITEPSALVASATITSQISCTNGGATITASATGGLPGYNYQLEDNSGNVIGSYDFATNGSNTVFNGLASGSYIVRVRDDNSCEDAIDTALTIAAINNIVFTATPTVCYSGENDASIAINVTSGNGDYTFSLNGQPWVTPSPSNATTHTFTNLANGTYTVNVSDGSACTGVAQTITINPKLTVTATADKISACATNSEININAQGGDTNYVYAVVTTNTTVTDGDFNSTNPVTGLSEGTYDVYVRDNSGNTGYCSAMYSITLVKDDPIVTSETTTDVTCNNNADGSISITVNSGGEGPFVYSIDNGATYATSGNFINLAAGNYQVKVKDANNCETVAKTIEIKQPNALVAFAAVTSLASCNPNKGAEVRITNPSGGTPTYEYSFNNGISFGTSPISNLPSGDHTLIIRDANLCTFEMQLTVEASPTAPTFTTSTTYDCNGIGTITVTADSNEFDYTYAIDGTPNTPATSNVFENVSLGSHTITVNYNRNGNIPNSLLLLEDFGSGAPTSISEIDPRFCFEPQDGSPSSCPQFGTDTHIQDGEYSVAHTIVNPYGWRVPNEQSGDPLGRYLAINIGGVAGNNGIIYAKRNIEVIPNTNIVISLDAFNLKFNGPTSIDADFDIQLVDPSGNVIASLTTGHLPKNQNEDDWKTYTVSLNPGAATNLDIVIRTNNTSQSGNDAVLDNLTAYQAPQQCSSSDTFSVVVEDGHAFEASITAFSNLMCNADDSGSITINAKNYGLEGYEYSLDGTTFVGPFMAEKQITGLAAGAHNITVRSVDNPVANCTTTLSKTLTEPATVEAAASITEEFKCLNSGATITASATGGTPTYQYQLEDNLGTIITAYQSATQFTNLPVGEYIVRVKDSNSCSDPIDSAITVVAPTNPTFTTTATACYSGENDGSIVVNVSSIPGNGGFQFRLNSGTWMTPTPATATSYTFSNLANGTYTIDVRDAYGCNGTQQTVTLNPNLHASIAIDNISSCADGTITVTASGGDGNFAYAYVSKGTAVSATDFVNSNTYSVTAGNEGDYDVYVWDNNGTNPHCEYKETVTVPLANTTAYTATPTDPACHDGVGSIEVNISSGDIPFTIELIDLDHSGGSNQTKTNVIVNSQTFFNLSPGNYTIKVTDFNGCILEKTPVTINNPEELTATIKPILPADCTSTDPLDYGFKFENYPTSYPAGTTIEFSDDGGSTWSTSDTFLSHLSGSSVHPSMRTVIGGVEICRIDFPRYIIPFPLDDLDISISTVVVACNELQVTVKGTKGVPSYEYAYTDDPSTFDISTASWTSPLLGSYVWEDLIPGRTYIFYVRDNSGCVRQSNVNVNDITTNPLEITATYEPSCSGANDAEITYTITDTDSTSHPSMKWEFYNANTGVLLQTNAGYPSAIAAASTISISGLSAGEYYIVVTEVDASGTDACVSGSENLLIEELDPITATLSKVSDIKCNAPGVIAIQNIHGGGGTFTYTVTGPSPFATITATSDNPISIPANSPAGDYNITITDQYGCFTDLGSVNLELAQNPTIDSIAVENCGTPTKLTINATSTAAKILYSIDGGTTYVDNGGVFNNLAANTYAISIIDSNGCVDTDSVTIHSTLQANARLTKLIDCSASSEAEITINVVSGSSNYDYQITNSAGTVVTRAILPSNPFVYKAATADDYTVTIFDNNTSGPECNVEISVNVPAAVLPSFTETHVNTTCNGSSEGSITLKDVTNGVHPLTYTISPNAGTFNSATNTFENLPTGTYTVTGTGTNGCTSDKTGIVISEPAAINVPAATVVEFGCVSGNNQNNASITIDNASITGGSGTYVRYEFINDQGTAAVGDDVIVQTGSSTSYLETNTDGGSYTIKVYDDKGCIGTANATIKPYVRISDAVVTITKNVTCNPGDDAEIKVDVTTMPASGSVDLSYAVEGVDNTYNAPNQPTNTFAGIGVGNYLVTVTNHNTGCIIQTTFRIKDPNTFEISTTTTNAVCFGDNGSVSFTINDDINPYSGGFTWQIYNTQGTVPTGDDVVVAGATGTSTNVGPTAPFAIPAGEYRVEITQTSDPSCVSSDAFTIAGPTAAITANTEVTNITCIGNDGVIEIIDVLGGWGNYSYYVGTTAPSSAGDYAATRRFDNLAPGTYEVWVVDQNGCQTQVQNNIVLADPTAISAQLQLNHANCPNFSGEIEVINVTGGQGSNYTYQLIKDGTAIGTAQNTPIFSGLAAGSYTVKVSDQWTCTFTTAAQLLYAPIVPLATVVKTIDCSSNPGGQITITQTGGSGNYNYQITYPDGVTTAQNSTGIFTGLTQVGEYIFTITDQVANQACQVTINKNLNEKILPVLTIEAFSNVNCNGSNDGSITVSALDNGVAPYTFEIISGGGSSVSAPIAPTTSTNNTATFNNLAATVAPGTTYTIRATGANGCTTDITKTIVQPEAIANINATVVEFGCTTGNNTNFATISIDTSAITGGSGNYVRYMFVNNQGTPATNDDIIVQNGVNSTYTETNIAGGSYTITAFDDEGCSGTTTANINSFVSISDATVSTLATITCNPGNDEQIQVGVIMNPSTATPNLEYVTRGIGVTYNQTNNNGVFGGLGVGNYEITITNLNTGCKLVTTYTVEDPNVIEVLATKISDDECLNDGTTDGSLSVTISNYTGDYSYQVYDFNNNPIAGFSGTSNTATSPLTISNLPGGLYYVEITETDKPFCSEKSNNITIIAPETPLSASVSEESNPSCTNDKGSIFVNPEGGFSPYTIVVTNNTTSESYTKTNVSAHIFDGLGSGNYSITITDSKGCLETKMLDLIAPDPLSATITATSLVCFNDNNGSVTATVNTRNITPTYLYRLNQYDATGTTIVTTSANQTQNTFTGLRAGFYSITVSDNFACVVETAIIEIENPEEVKAELIRTSPLTCDTGVELLLTASGGSGTYEYSTDNVNWITMTGSSQNLPTTGTLPAGTYRYYVRDAINGCTAVQTNEISEEPIDALTLTLNTDAAFINCNGETTASIIASATGGLGNYMFELYTDASLNAASRIVGPQSSGEFYNLGAGTYYVNVFSEDCEAPAQRVDIVNPPLLEATEVVTDVLCFGEANGSIVVTATGGSGVYQYAISPNLNQFSTKNSFQDLAPGNYSVIIQDSNGCFIQKDYTIENPEPLTVSATAVSETCWGSNDGSINLSIAGGTAPYSTKLSTETDFVQDRTSITNLTGGDYIIFVVDANGCEANTGIRVTPGPNLNATVEVVYECNSEQPNNYLRVTLEDSSESGNVLYALDSTDPSDLRLSSDFRDISPGSHYLTIAHANACSSTYNFEIEEFEPLSLSLAQHTLNVITATGSGGKENYTYIFDGIDNGDNNTFRIDRTDTYMVTVIDANGCRAEASIFIEFVDIEIPNFFTPDGDHKNDTWKPKNIEGFPEILTIIFDRYGRELYRINLNTPGWEGLYNDQELPTGDYWYTIKLNGQRDNREFVGHFTLYR